MKHGIIAAAALALLTAACGGSPSSTGAGGSNRSQVLAFSQCMRSHGVPRFPDPDPSTGGVKIDSAQQYGVSDSQLQAAENDCLRLLPAGVGDQFPPAEVPLLLPAMRSFSQCMRSHGEPNFPDPTVDAQGRPVFDVSDAGFSRDQTHSPQFSAQMNECGHLLPSQLGGIPLG
jgi:hypothetical protein